LLYLAFFTIDVHLTKDNRIAAQQREINDLKERLKEGADVITSNQEVITWLNRELSRYQLSGPGTMSPDSIMYGPSGSASMSKTPAAMRKYDAQGTPDTDVTGTTHATSTISVLSGPGGYAEKGSAVGGYKDSYEYLRAIDGLGGTGFDDIDMEVLGLGSNSKGGKHYYDGLLDAGPSGLVRSEAIINHSTTSATTAAGEQGQGSVKYAWQAADFGLDGQ
jgi:hypothetical protein